MKQSSYKPVDWEWICVLVYQLGKAQRPISITAQTLKPAIREDIQDSTVVFPLL